MLILGDVGLQIRLSDCSMFNVQLDLRSLAKQECLMYNFFAAKVQHWRTLILTFRSFRSINLKQITLFNFFQLSQAPLAKQELHRPKAC